jgi:endonuclease/exonuclease/phosphatase family metal-dependent hydrolase
MTGALSVLTLNLWNVNQPLRLRMDRLVDYLRSDPPDVVALQEDRRAGGRLQSETIAARAGYDFVHTVRATCDPWPEEGLAVLTRLPSRPWPSIPLPRMRMLQRVVVRVAQGGPRLVVANTHLAYRRSDAARRLAQSRIVCDALDRSIARCPVVLCGDMNDDPRSEPLEAFRRAGLTDAWEAAGGGGIGLTFSSANPWTTEAFLPDRRLDYVLVSPGSAIGACDIVLTGDDGWGPVSDHYGVRVRLTLDGATPG